MTPLGTTVLPAPAVSRMRRPRLGRALVVALALSIGVHLAWTFWPVDEPPVPETTVLTATLTEMPPPPKPAAQAPAARRKAPPKRALVRPAPETRIPEPANDAAVETASESPPAGGAPAQSEAPAAVPAPEPPLAETRIPELPARLDLAYKVFLGTHGFLIGEATYRFEHEGNQYAIATVAQARGLAALIVRGRGKVESRGVITPAGLLPLEFVVERGSTDRREVARFDWEAGVVTLHEDKTAGLEEPTFDPMTLMWQPYFSPPQVDEATFHVATTRRVTRYTITREGEDRIAWGQGEVDAERWHRVSDDGKTDAYVWLAPSLHYVPVKMRVSQTMRGTLEVVLDTIRVDEPRPVAAQ
jgi:uncharacterized protein DUF3108